MLRNSVCGMTNVLLIGEVKGLGQPGCPWSNLNDVALSGYQN